MEKSKSIKHESFGLIRFSRISGNTTFFGSQLKHNHYIQLEINQAEVETHLGSESYFGGKNILRARMTAVQFAEMLTSMNYGSGIPCTIETLVGRSLDDCPQMDSSKDIAENEFRKFNEGFLSEMGERYSKALKIIKKKNLSKADQDELEWFFGKAIQHVKSNVPFYEDQFKDRVDKLVVEAKCEIESAILSKVTNAGFKSLEASGLLTIRE